MRSLEGLLDPALTNLAEAAEVPLGCCGPEEIDGFLDAVAKVRTLADALMATALAAAAEVRAAATGSSVGVARRAVAADLAARTRVNPKAVAGDQRLGHWLQTFPVFAAAFLAGRITREHASLLRRVDNTRTRDALISAQTDFCDAADVCAWPEFVAVVRYWQLRADPDGPEPREQVRRRQCHLTKSYDGTVKGSFTLDPLSGQVVKTAIELEEQRLFREDAETGSERTATQRRADAIVNLITSGASTGQRSGVTPLVHLVLGHRAYQDLINHAAAHSDDRSDGDVGGRGDVAGGGPSWWPVDADDPDRRCELADGTPLHPQFALLAATAGRFRRLVLDAKSAVTDLGHGTKLFPPHLKQALLAAARGRCQHPGCDAPFSWLQADHIHPRSRNGATSLANGQILCDPHNKQKRDTPPPRRAPEPPAGPPTPPQRK